VRVCLDDLDVRQPLFGHQLPRHGDVDRVYLQSYDAAPGADPLGEQLEDSTRAASDVDRALSLSGADSIQQLGGQGFEFGGLSPQPLSFGGVSPQRIRHRRRRIRRTGAFIDAHARPPVDVARDRAEQDGTSGLGTEDLAEIKRLRAENAELRMERDVLKRSVVLWVKEATK
jgi:hypothetical protein